MAFRSGVVLALLPTALKDDLQEQANGRRHKSHFWRAAARFSEDGRWRAARHENRDRPVIDRSCAALAATRIFMVSISGNESPVLIRLTPKPT